MGVHALVSAKGSPGVTTTLVALTRLWHDATNGRQALTLDLDPAGGDVAAGVLAGSVPAGAGVLALATHRAEQPREALDAAAVDVTGHGLGRIVPGVPDAARAGAIPLAWDVVKAALPELASDGVDVLLDGGRLVSPSPAPAWLEDVNQGLLVVRPSLPWVAAAHGLARWWPQRIPLAVTVVDSPSPYTAHEVARAIGLPLLQIIPFDPRTASVHSDGTAPGRSQRRSAYSRAIGRLADGLVGRAAATPDAEPLGRPAASSGPAEGFPPEQPVEVGS